MSLKRGLCIIKVPFKYVQELVMAPNLAPSKRDLIHDMIVDEKLKTRQMAGAVNARSKQYAQTFIIFGTTKAPSKWC
jgi:hypothetical protein